MAMSPNFFNKREPVNPSLRPGATPSNPRRPYIAEPDAIPATCVPCPDVSR